MLGTRPDLAYIVRKLSQFSSNPGAEHVLALFRAVAYIRKHTSLCLKYQRVNHGNAIDPSGYTDSDWAGDLEDSKSTAGYVFLLGEAAFSWYCKKQGHVSSSTADAEYTALFRGGEQAFWLRQFYDQIELPLSHPITIYCDNQAAIAMAKNQGTHSKTKATRIELHAVRDRITRREIEVEYVESKKNIADIFTKGLPRETFELHRDSLGFEHVTNVLSSLSVEDDVDTSFSTQFDDAPSFLL